MRRAPSHAAVAWSCAAITLLASAASASGPIGVRPSDIRLTAATDCLHRAVATDGRVYVTHDGGRAWRLIFSTPASPTVTEHGGADRRTLDIDSTESLSGTLASGLLRANLRDLWWFGDGETGLDFLDSTDGESPLAPSDTPSGFPEAGEWSLTDDLGHGIRGTRAKRLLTASHAATRGRRITALSLDEAGVHIAVEGDGCTLVDDTGARPEPCSEPAPEVDLQCPARVAGVRVRGPSLDSLLAAADLRFGEAHRFERDADAAAARAAWVPRLAVIGGYASFDQGAILAAAFLDQTMPFSRVKTRGGYGFGDVGGTLADGQNITFQKDSQTRFPYVVAVLSWDLAGPSAPPPSSPLLGSMDDAEALRSEVASLWSERAVAAAGPPDPSPYEAALNTLRREELDALLEALTGITLSDDDTSR